MNELVEASPKVLDRTGRIPRQVWVAAGLLAFLRTLPFLVALVQPAPAMMVRLPVGYPDKDWFAYAGFIEQTGHPSYIFLANPFTTEPQSGRFILLFHSLLGTIHVWTGLNSFCLLELSRVPLIFLFMLVLWRFLAPIYPETRERIWCCWLVAFAGGVEFLLIFVAPFLPPWLSTMVTETMHTWNTFQSVANSFWVAGLTLMLLCLGPILRPSGPLGSKARISLFVGALLLFFVHPYSAIVLLAVFAAHIALKLVFQLPVDWKKTLAAGVPLFLATSIFSIVSMWQREDAVYRRCSGGFLGTQELSVFWYPLTYGLLAVFALRGWRKWIAERHAWRYSLGAWTLAAILLHTSPVFNGYHFITYLHLPVCIVATPAVISAIDAFRNAAPNRSSMPLRAWAICVPLFASSVFSTVWSIQQAGETNLVPKDFMKAIELLQLETPGNVLGSAAQGNVIAAFTQHRVYVGQWFLTPDYTERAAEYKDLVRNIGANGPRLRTLLAGQNIRYFFVPNTQLADAHKILGASIERSIPTEYFSVLILARQKGL